MGNHDAVLKQYYRSISKELPCSQKMKKQILLQIQENVSIFLEQNSDATFEMVQARFGTAQEIAASYIEDQDASVLLRKMNIKRKAVAVIAAALSIALLIWTAVVMGTALDAKNTHDGYIIVDINEE